MTIQRGVSLYSYQQSQFIKRLNLQQMIEEVGSNLYGANGIELVDEMSLRYPDPGEAFVREWFGWHEKYGTRPVAMDVGMDVLQFRDHVMTYEECAERLKSDIRLAKRLGFTNVRTLSVVPIEIIEMALPLAESLDIKLGKEIHQPMTLEGVEVTQILDLVERTGTSHLGIVPDLGIFQFRPSEVLLEWLERKGAQPSASEASVELALMVRDGGAAYEHFKVSKQTAGNIRAAFGSFVQTGVVAPGLKDAFQGVKEFTEIKVENPQAIDYRTVAEALMMSHTSLDALRDLVPQITHIHGKFNYMSEVPGSVGEFTEISIDYPGVIGALKAGGYLGYINSEYEGQRYFQDRGLEGIKDEVDQVRRHQAMLVKLIGA